MATERMQQVSVCLPKPIVSTLQKMAERDKVPLAIIARMLIIKALELNTAIVENPKQIPQALTRLKG